MRSPPARCSSPAPSRTPRSRHRQDAGFLATLRLIPTETLRQPSTPTCTNRARLLKIPTNLLFITQTPLGLLDSSLHPYPLSSQAGSLTRQVGKSETEGSSTKVLEGRDAGLNPRKLLLRIPKMLALEPLPVAEFRPPLPSAG